MFLDNNIYYFPEFYTMHPKYGDSKKYNSPFNAYTAFILIMQIKRLYNKHCNSCK